MVLPDPLPSSIAPFLEVGQVGWGDRSGRIRRHLLLWGQAVRLDFEGSEKLHIYLPGAEDLEVSTCLLQEHRAF